MKTNYIALEATEEQIKQIRSFVELLQKNSDSEMTDKTAEYAYLRVRGLVDGLIDK